MEKILEFCEGMMDIAMDKLGKSEDQMATNFNAGVMFACEAVIRTVRKEMQNEDSDRD